MFLTRIGFGTKVVVTGDVTQIDITGAVRACSTSKNFSARSKGSRSSASVKPTSFATASCARSSPRTTAPPSTEHRLGAAHSATTASPLKTSESIEGRNGSHENTPSQANAISPDRPVQ